MPPTRGDDATLPARRTPMGAPATQALRDAARRLAARAFPWLAPGSAGLRSFDLERDAIVTFDAGRAGLVLTCVRGCFLVTQERDPTDHLLEAGDVLRTRARGRVVAWALRAGVLMAPSSGRLRQAETASPV